MPAASKPARSGPALRGGSGRRVHAACCAALLVALASGAITDDAAAAPGDADGPGISVVASDPDGRSGPPSVGVRVQGSAPGNRPAGPTAGTSAAVAAQCRWVAAPDMESWLRRLPSQLPSAGADRVPKTARLYSRTCSGVGQSYAWLGPAGEADTPRSPTPTELAQEAYAQLRLPVPTARRSPDLRLDDGRPAVLVGEQTWVWTDRSRFVVRSRRLQAGSVWARVTATPLRLTFDPGDGTQIVSCPGPGTPFVTGRDDVHGASPTCGHQYLRSSSGTPGGLVHAEYGITWRVEWTGAAGPTPAGGQLPEMTSRTAVPFAVAEAQALVARRVDR